MRFKAQIESGYTFTRSGADREHAIGEILVRVPVAERVEFRFGLPSYLFFRSDAQDEEGGDASGFADAFLGAKFALSESSGETGFFSASGDRTSGRDQFADRRQCFPRR